MIMDLAYIVMAIMCVLICGDTNAHLSLHSLHRLMVAVG